MKETYSKLNSTQRIVVNFLQQLVTECTDRVPVTQPCTVASTTDYSVPTGYTALYIYLNYWLQCTDRVPATQPCTVFSTTGYRVYRLVQATHSSLNSLLHISQLQSLPAYYQPAPRIPKLQGLLPAGHSSAAAYSPA